MLIDVRATNFGLQAGIREYIERRMNMNLDAFDGRVERVDVVLTNLHGRNHVRRLQCRVVAHLRHVADLLVQQVDADLAAAVDLAAGRMKRTVRQQICRQRDLRRRAGRRTGV